AMDALGNGVSSSPSNSTAQPDDTFPIFTVRDMVNTQRQALKQTLRITHVYAILGGSMGGMQTFQWLVSYPEFMERAVAYVGAPWSSSYGRLVWKAEAEVIENGLACGQAPEEIARHVSLIQILNAYTPDYRNRSTPASEADQFAQEYLSRFLKNFRVYDWYRQIQAMQKHDVTAAFSGSKSAAVAAVQAPTLIIASRQDHLVPPGPAEEWAALSGADLVVLDNDCGHLAPGCEMKRFVRLVHDFLDQP
ncbi:MAG: alpha/beta fold hydrolase, partial [Fidelibacterota bacterium]